MDELLLDALIDSLLQSYGPLHPWLVHLPIAFALFAPAAALLGLRLARGPGEKRAWGFVVLFHLLLSAVTYAAMAAGDADADQILNSAGGVVARETPEWLPEALDRSFRRSLERFLPGAGQDPQLEERIAGHRAAGERFFLLGLGALALAAIAWKPGRQAVYLRTLLLVVNLALLGFMIPAAHLGGKLVYEHGAAEFWVQQNATEAKNGDAEAQSDDE